MSEIDGFLKYLKEEKNRSKETVRGYSSDLQQLSVFLKGDFTKMSQKQVNDFAQSLISLEYTPSTISRKLSVVQSFLRWLGKDVKKIKVPRVKNKRKNPKCVPLEHIDMLVKSISVDKISKSRDIAIIRMITQCGLTISEICNLRKNDVWENSIHIRSSNGRSRTVPLTEQVKEALIKYEELFRLTHDRLVPLDGILFPSKDGIKITGRSIRRNIERYAIGAKLDVEINPRNLRNTYVVETIRYKSLRKSTMKLVGIRSLSSLKVYKKLLGDKTSMPS